jgi:hypothetical protein
MDADPFSSGREALSKSPAPTHASEGEARRAPAPGWLLFGYFLLEEKVTRPSADGRNARRAGEQSRDNAKPKTMRQKNNINSLDPAPCSAEKYPAH